MDCRQRLDRGEAGLVRDLSLPEQLDYMADLILELQRMAEDADLGMLANALRVAHSEARSRASGKA